MPKLPTRKQFGSQIQKARIAANLSQGALAKELGLPTWAIPQLEGGRAIGPARIEKIAGYLKVPVPKEFKKDATAIQPRTKAPAVKVPLDPGKTIQPELSLGQALDRVFDTLDKMDASDRQVVMKIINDRFQAI